MRESKGTITCSILIAFQNIRKWRTDYRIWMLAILMGIITHSNTVAISQVALEMGEKVAPWIFPFLYTDRYVLILYMVPLIFLYCDAPFIDNNQLFVLLRSKRTPWIIGQVLYIVLTSVIYFTTLTILPIVLHIRHITYMDDWGMVLGRMAISGTALVEGTAFTVSNHIVTYFTPQQAMFYAWLLSVLFGIFIGIMICMLNIITKHRIVAMVVAGFVVLFQTLARSMEMKWFSPASWAVLPNLDVGGRTALPTIGYVLIIYLVGILFMSIAVVIRFRKMDIRKER